MFCDNSVELNGQQVYVQTWGKSVNDDLTNVKQIILYIPGNPGIPGLYSVFLSELYEKTQRKFPIWSISHVGHDLPPNNTGEKTKLPSVKNTTDVFNCKGQLNSKVSFLD